MKESQSSSPKFRTDLEVIPRFEDGGELRYLIKDPLTDEVYDFGQEEWFLCRQMDGRTPTSEIVSSFSEHAGIPLTLIQLEAFIRRLHSLNFLCHRENNQTPQRETQKEIRIGNPDKLLGLLDAGFGWCFSIPFLIFTILTITLGIGTAVRYSRELMFEFNFIYALYSPGMFLIAMALGWLVVSPLGELAKGIACKHYGGHIYDCNIVMAFRIFPRCYFDISDIMWHEEKGTRLRVLAAGLIFQLFLFSVSVIAWAYTTAGSEANVFLFLLLVATGLFFLFNLLPLVQRDGYLLLSNWIEIPDLHTRAKDWTRSWFFRRPIPEPLTSREKILFQRYGLLTHLFEIVFWSLVLWQLGSRITEALQGVGAALFSLFLLFRFEHPIRRFLVSMPGMRRVSQSQGGVKPRLLVRLSLLVIFIVLMFVPYPFDAGGDFRLLPIDEQGIRPRVSGEIGEVYVREGQWVSQGEPLAQLVGRDQQKRVEQVQAAIDRAQAKREMYAKGAKPEEIAAAEQKVRAARQSLKYSQSQATRAEKMFKEKAIPERDYENALRVRDMDRDRLELAKRNLELVQSGFREEQLEEAEAEIRFLEVDLAHAQKDLDLITLVSPIDGQIITPRMQEKEGQYFLEGELFAVVEDARRLIAEIELPEKEAGEVKIGAQVKLRIWADPNTVIRTRVSKIAPVAYEKSRGRIERSYSDREWLIEQNETIREKGNVIRVICELDNPDGRLKTGMTGYAKIEAKKRPVALAFTRWLMRFLFVEVWSWIP